MQNKELIKKLQSFKRIKPRSEWIIQNREILLTQIRSQSKSERDIKKSFDYYVEFLRLFFPSRWVLRPVGIFILIATVVLGSNLATVRAAQSLPGDLLYPLKLASEMAQMTFTLSEEKKVELEIEFTGRRLDELKKIQEKVDEPDFERKEKIQEAVKKVKENVERVENRLKSIEEEREPRTVVEVAKSVNDKTEEYKYELERLIEELRKDVSDDIQKSKDDMSEALSSIVKVNTSTLETMIEKRDEQVVSEDEIVERLEKKIVDAENGVNSIYKRLGRLKGAYFDVRKDRDEKLVDVLGESEQSGESEQDDVGVENVVEDEEEIQEVGVDMTEENGEDRSVEGQVEQGQGVEQELEEAQTAEENDTVEAVEEIQQQEVQDSQVEQDLSKLSITEENIEVVLGYVKSQSDVVVEMIAKTRQEIENKNLSDALDIITKANTLVVELDGKLDEIEEFVKSISQEKTQENVVQDGEQDAVIQDQEDRSQSQDIDSTFDQSQEQMLENQVEEDGDSEIDTADTEQYGSKDESRQEGDVGGGEIRAEMLLEDGKIEAEDVVSDSEDSSSEDSSGYSKKESDRVPDSTTSVGEKGSEDEKGEAVEDVDVDISSGADLLSLL